MVALLSLLFLASALWSESSNRFSMELTRLLYTDDLGRSVDFDFSGGVVEPNGVVHFPPSAVEPADAEFYWQPLGEEVQLEDGSKGAVMSVEQPDFVIKPIPQATITVDGDPCDWVSIDTFVVDKNAYGDIVSVPGSDIDYVKLAYNEDGSRLNILIKVADAISEDVCYRLYFDRYGDRDLKNYLNFIVEIVYDSESGWTLVGNRWAAEYEINVVAVSGQAASTGAFLEGSFDTTLAVLPDSFYVSGESLELLSTPIYNTYVLLKLQKAGRDRLLLTDLPLDFFEGPRRFRWGVYSLAADNIDSGAADTWELEARFESFQNVARDQIFYNCALALNDPNIYEPAGAYMWASWFSGRMLIEYDKQLFIGANLGGISRSVVNGISDLDPCSVQLDMKIQVQNVNGIRQASALYSINDGSWEILLTRALAEGQMTGFPQLIPQVWLWPGLYKNLPDLTGEIQASSVPQFLIPGNSYNLNVLISNVGDYLAAFRFMVDIYISSDQTLDQDDILISQRNYYPISLWQLGQYIHSAKITIPTDAPVGDYYLIAVVDAANDISETDESTESNVDVTSVQIPLVLRFGNLPDTSGNTKLTVSGNGSASGTFSLTGGGWGEVEGTAEPGVFNVNLYDTGTNSSMSITSNNNGSGIILGDIVVPGSLNNLSAPNTNLQGDIQIAGSLARLELHNVLDQDDSPDGHSIVIAGLPANSAQTVRLSFNQVANLSLTSTNIPIGPLTAVEWLNTDDANDVIQAPRLDMLWIKGDTQADLAGDFEANLNLTGGTSLNIVSQGARISGSLRNADWNLAGSLGYLFVGDEIKDSEILVETDVRFIMAGALDNSQLDVLDTLNLMFLLGNNNSYFTDSYISAPNIGTVIFVKLPQSVSGAIQYCKLTGSFNVPEVLLVPMLSMCD